MVVIYHWAHVCSVVVVVVVVVLVVGKSLMVFEEEAG